MEKNEKVREHIVIEEKQNISFADIVAVFVDIVTNILDDDLVTFAFINEQGLIVGSENVFPVESYIYDEGTLFRAYTQVGRWRISAIRRRDSGAVTLIEFLAPYTTAEKIKEVVDYVLEKIEGTKCMVL